MSDAALRELAEAAGVSPGWTDYRGSPHDVAPDTLRAILAATGVAARTEAEIRDSLGELRAAAGARPLVTAELGQPIDLDTAGRWRLVLEDGTASEGGGALPPIGVAGYHKLHTDGREVTLAVAPRSCHKLPPGRPWGLAVQLYALRREGDGGLGDFGGLCDFVRNAASHGADAVAISPVHAQFSADPDRFSPYAPSSRIMLNVLHAEAPRGDAGREAAALVDWPASARDRLAQFRTMFEAGEHAASFAEFRAAEGETLEAHSRFEALHAHFYAKDVGKWHWRDWPAAYRDPASPEVAQFAALHEREVALQAYLQFLADRGLAAAQAAARDAGMRIGLISDLAVGTDGGGSHAWSRQDETLIGLTVGAPPDLMSPNGQDWGLAAFSPRGLLTHGFAAYIEMLRAALRHAGGVRIDHAMGLQRLWVRPEGVAPGEGAYLQFPVQDMLRLTALESHRHRAIVLGEDLGTVPYGFQQRLIEAGVLGLRVLWFERQEYRFDPPGDWSRAATAMTSTHDLPTVAGWWSGRDLQWRRELKLMGDDAAAAREQDAREHDRPRLWEAFRASGAAEGDAPPPDHPARVVDAACAHIGRAACDFVLLPVEDALGRVEQPNLPGTLDEHPNWRRRLDGPAASLLDQPEVAARLAALARSRSL